MVTSLNQSTPARDILFINSVAYICGRVTLTAADTPVVKIGTIPAGAAIISLNFRVVTAFTGGTPVIGVGSVTAGGAVPAVGATGNIFQPVATITTGASTTAQPSATVAQPLATDTDIYAGTSGAATAGDIIVVIGYIKPLS